jgi:hypothetical protein
VHLLLMTGVRARVHAVVDWALANVLRTRGPQVLDRAEATEIDWDDDRAVTSAGPTVAR